MQQVLSVLWSLDDKFVLSGSDEMNIRVWKANASEKLGPVRLFSCFFFNFITGDYFLDEVIVPANTNMME